MKKLDQLLNEEYVQDNQEDIQKSLKSTERFKIRTASAMIALAVLIIMGISAGTSSVIVREKSKETKATIQGEVKQLLAKNDSIPEDEMNKLVYKVLEETDRQVDSGQVTELSQNEIDSIYDKVQSQVYEKYSQ